MARHRITVRSLAAELKVREATVSHLKNSERLPRLDSDRICAIAAALSSLSGKKISPMELLEFVED